MNRKPSGGNAEIKKAGLMGPARNKLPLLLLDQFCKIMYRTY
jgi:hypothetical protein